MLTSKHRGEESACILQSMGSQSITRAGNAKREKATCDMPLYTKGNIKTLAICLCFLKQNEESNGVLGCLVAVKKICKASIQRFLAY